MISAASFTAVFTGNSASSSFSTRSGSASSRTTATGCSTSANSPRLRDGDAASQAGNAAQGIVAAFVMSANARKPIYAQQRDLLSELADVLLWTAPRNLDPGFIESAARYWGKHIQFGLAEAFEVLKDEPRPAR